MKIKILLFAALTLILAGCDTSEKKKVEKFAEDFGVLVMKRDSRGIAEVYPEAKGLEVGFNGAVDDFTIDDKNSFGIWRIHYGNKSWVDVKANSHGDLEIIDSEGIISSPVSGDAFDGPSAPRVSSTPKKTGPEKLRVTDISNGPYGALANQGSNSYQAKNMFDGKNSTAWAITLPYHMYDWETYIFGPSFKVNGSKLDYVIIRNGYHKSSDSYRKNTRASWIRIARQTGDPDPSYSDIIYEGHLSDSMTPQRLKVNPGFDQSRPIGYVEIVFTDLEGDGFYHGSKWDDLTVSELEFWGKR